MDRLTKIRSRHVLLGTVVERREECLIRNPRVVHPLLEAGSHGVVKDKVNKTALHRYVNRTLC